ncbi:MAG: SAM-dependent chlorinase/fluorinase [Calothrix sp. MO_167.B42]|nr:SAM-dependent chlorinase/fluorinase [Calothrix sp. MO_167.B42]
MRQQKLLTLLSDFGDRDEYVGVMKGVIAQINASTRIIDITHQIPPQNIAAGRFCLRNAYPHFPQGTVHVVVVDPGVGGKRRAIAVQLASGFLVGPDNGLLSGVLCDHDAIAAIELTNQNYWYTSTPSSTFHGRDIFAPVGAHLANGVAMQELGTPINPATLVKLELAECIYQCDRILGCIQYIDHFGNLVTNIPGSSVSGKDWYVQVGDQFISNSQTYADRKIGEAIALIGSHNWVEIAVNSGNAQLQLQMELGNEITVQWG